MTESVWVDPAAFRDEASTPTSPLEQTTLSYSKLRTLHVNGALTYQRRYLEGLKDPMTEAQILGIATHKKLLEPESFGEDFLVLPKLDKRKKADKEQYENAVEEAAVEGKLIIQEPAAEAAAAMAAAVSSHPLVAPLLEDALKEVELRWHKTATYGGQQHNFPTVAYLDFLNPTLKAMGDLKVISGGFDPYRFPSKAKKEFYYGQTGLYLEGAEANSIEVESFNFILVSSKAPYDVAVCPTEREFMERGRTAATTTTNALYQRLLSNNWISYPEPIPVNFVPW